MKITKYQRHADPTKVIVHVTAAKLPVGFTKVVDDLAYRTALEGAGQMQD